MRHKEVVGTMGLCLVVLLTAVGCGSTVAPEATQGPTAADTAVQSSEGSGEVMTTASGLQYIEIEVGQGAPAENGKQVTVHYRGRLEDGTEFDNSYDRGEPLTFILGQGRVIPGWEEGIGLMKEGGKAQLIIPPGLAYGDRGAGSVIPPNATLIFDVELVAVHDAPQRPAAPEAPTAVDPADYIETASGLKYYDLKVGEGPAAQTGQAVAVLYTGWLEDGTRFDSSYDRGYPFVFTLGEGRVIPGWDEGVVGMQEGGKRQLLIPPELAYGEKGASGVIPPNAKLVFEVDLVDIQQ